MNTQATKPLTSLCKARDKFLSVASIGNEIEYFCIKHMEWKIGLITNVNVTVDDRWLIIDKSGREHIYNGPNRPVSHAVKMTGVEIDYTKRISYMDLARYSVKEG